MALSDNAVLKTQTLGDGRRQPARFKAGESRLGSQDRSNPAPHVDGRHNLPVGRSEADRSAGLIKEEYETQAGPNRGPYCPKSRRRDGGCGKAVTRPRGSHPTNHAYLDRLTAPSDSIVWRP